MEEATKLRKASRFTWSKEDAEFLKEWYGKINLSKMCEILDKTKCSVRGQVWRKGLKAQPDITERIVVTHRGHSYTIQPKRYLTTINKEGKRTCTDTQRTGKPRKLKVDKPKSEIRINRKHEKAEVVIQKFETPIGKKLVKIDNKTWAYR